MGIRDRIVARLMPEGGITVDEALNLLAKGGVLCDVRTLPEYEAGHAPGARLVDVKKLAESVMDAVYEGDPFAEPENPIILVCESGFRSGHAVQLVREQGFRAEFIAGGLNAWHQAGQILIPGPPRRR